MTAIWIGGTGNWNVASNWSPAAPLDRRRRRTLQPSARPGGPNQVTIGTADVAASLTESSAKATVDDNGSLTLTGTFTLSAGTFNLGGGGTLSGGTTKLTGGPSFATAAR